ncbi:MAG: hypothetical protein BYD32DRAFT_490976 [Podila humilis]|nr:MAG: hypothetical protein BYD32DRAFT_490976 [Podila humilis]
MKFSFKALSIGAAIASLAVAAPIEVAKRDANSDRIAACFINLLLTRSWPGTCQAAVAVPLGLIKTITINQMSMDFTPADPWAPTTSSNSVVATMLSIPGITLPIDSIRQHIILTDNGVQIGNIETPWSAASVNGGTLTSSFPSSTLAVFPTSHKAFSNFIGSLSAAKTKTVTLQGAVDAKLNFGIFGHLTIPGIGFKTDTVFQGLNGLTEIKYLYLIDNNYDFANNKMTMTTIVNIKNPSNLSLKLGDVNFSTSSAGEYVGISTIKNLNLVPGDNYVISGTVLEIGRDAAFKFLNSLETADGTLVMSGFNATSSDEALNAGLGALKSNLVVPKQFQGSTVSQPPYKNWSLKVLPTTKTDGLVDITATFASPYYGYPFEMTSDEPADKDNYAFVKGVSNDVDQLRLFEFRNTLHFKVSGTGSTTVTFKANIIGFVQRDRTRVEQLVKYAAANGGIPVDFWWVAGGIVNNDGLQRSELDWGTSGTGLGGVKIATGADFASILDSVPA